MEFLVIVLTLLAVLAALLLIGVVLIQPGKSDMIAGMGGFGGQVTNLLGVRSSRNILQTATLVLGGVLVLIALVVNKFFITPESTERAPMTQGAEIPAAAAPGTAPTSLPPAQQQPAQPQQAQPQQQPAPQGK
jgi:preprotein translocase subunit SecG